MSLRPIRGRDLLFTSLCTVKSLLNKHLLTQSCYALDWQHVMQSVISQLRRTLQPFQSSLPVSVVDKDFIVCSVSPTSSRVTETLMSIFVT